MAHQIVLLNGPPKCGKDTIVSGLTQYLDFKHMKFAAPIKRMAAGLLDMRESLVEQLKDDEFSILCKETFNGEKYEYGPKDTLRKLLIAFSEDFLKPRYGDRIFGRIAAREIKRSPTSLIIFSDAGFESEVEAVTSALGKGNTLLIRVHRNGCDFTNDSRSYLPDVAGTCYDIQNDDTISFAVAQVARRISRSFSIELKKEIEL